VDIEISVFEGDYNQYFDFISSFQIATNHLSITKAHKFLVLKSHLGFKLALLLTGLEQSDGSFDKSIAALDETYNVTMSKQESSLRCRKNL
jgi:hypothetical protein